MGVPRSALPSWDHLQILAGPAGSPTPPRRGTGGNRAGARAHRRPGPSACEIPLFVSDMSVGALSEEAKLALARGAEQAGTGICSGEGGMLPEEQAANSRYLYELAPGLIRLPPRVAPAGPGVPLQGRTGGQDRSWGSLPRHQDHGSDCGVARRF